MSGAEPAPLRGAPGIRMWLPWSPRLGFFVIPIYFDELAYVLRACAQLRPAECAPADLRRLMAGHLAHVNPGLAEKVLAFDGPQFTALSAFVLQAQALVGMTGGAPHPRG